ncbi:NAD(P)/FAD-dependent oxidoreductase, partial [Leadbetterella sp. DM7]
EEGRRVGVDLRVRTAVQWIERTADGYRLDTDIGPVATTSLVIATGGLSIPTLGATGFGYDVARQFGHEVLPTRAGLVPFI